MSSLSADATPSRRGHPLALLFWSLMAAVYAMPLILIVATRWRGLDVAPGPKTYAFCTFYPMALVALAVTIVSADFVSIYAYLIRRVRRLPGPVVGAIYAVSAFLAVVLVISGAPSASFAWRDYSIRGNTTGITVLLLTLVIEIFATTMIGCQLLAFARRWRRLGRRPPPPPQSTAATPN